MSQSVCIIYGLNEGPAMGRKLVRTLQKAGFTIVNDPATADVIFAHSGGCYLIPPKNQAKLVVLAGLAYWPGRPWLIATARKLFREADIYRRSHQLTYWGQKWLYYLRYAWNPIPLLRMAWNRSLTRPWNGVQAQLIIRNQDDVYCIPDIVDLPYKGPRTFISLPGEHDDCWDNPERYVNLLQSLA